MDNINQLQVNCPKVASYHPLSSRSPGWITVVVGSGRPAGGRTRIRRLFSTLILTSQLVDNLRFDNYELYDYAFSSSYRRLSAPLPPPPRRQNKRFFVSHFALAVTLHVCLPRPSLLNCLFYRLGSTLPKLQLRRHVSYICLWFVPLWHTMSFPRIPWPATCSMNSLWPTYQQCKDWQLFWHVVVSAVWGWHRRRLLQPKIRWGKSQ